MNTFIDMFTEKDTYTANGAVTNSTSHNFNIDLFFLAGACRNESIENIENALIKSWSYDSIKTLKIIFWAGDIRQGAGERRFFKIALNWLNNEHREELNKYLPYVPEYSRWDVLFELDNAYVLSFICEKIKEGKDNLLFKWLPRKSKVTDKTKTVIKSGSSTVTTMKTNKRCIHNGLAGKLQKMLGLSPKQYRKLLVEKTKVVESQMCSKEWAKINYEQVPSVAMHKYNKAWYRNDSERFSKYIEAVNNGEKKINAAAIFPHDIIKNALGYSSRRLNPAEIAQWNNLPNWLEGTVNSMIPVCDTSGSMWGLPIEICVSLGLYISERNEGPFKDAFITFSDNPKMQYLKGNINQRIKQLENADWGGSTNLVAVFRLILQKALENHLAPELMPKTILIISDMEFNSCGRLTNYETIKEAYRTSGYRCPEIAFWNVNGRVKNVPITVNEQGVALISGASPSIIKSVLCGELSPVDIMNRVIESGRYNFIK